MSSISEKFETLNCHNKFYIPNLQIALENAIGQKDIPTIIALSQEIARFKVLCGYTPAIQRFEESMKMYGHELNLLDRPEIKRALETVPRKTCSRCKCNDSEQPPQHREGFIGMLECAHGVENNPTQESESVELSQPTEDGFTSMLTASQNRSLDEFPQICTKQCPHTQCSSWGNPPMENQLCRNIVLTTEQMKHAQTRTIDNDKLNNLLARLETLEKEVVNAENSPKNEHIFPNRPNLCKTKNPNGLDEE